MSDTHPTEDQCIKHGSYVGGLCPQCVELLEARLTLLQQAEHVRAAEAVESQKMIGALTAKCEEIAANNQDLYGSLSRITTEATRLQKVEQQFHEVMGALRRTKMEHGLCEPVERNACTHCAAQRKLDKMLAEYKGPRVILA